MGLARVGDPGTTECARCQGFSHSENKATERGSPEGGKPEIPRGLQGCYGGGRKRSPARTPFPAGDGDRLEPVFPTREGLGAPQPQRELTEDETNQTWKNPSSVCVCVGRAQPTPINPFLDLLPLPPYVPSPGGHSLIRNTDWKPETQGRDSGSGKGLEGCWSFRLSQPGEELCRKPGPEAGSCWPREPCGQHDGPPTPTPPDRYLSPAR